MVEKDKKQKQTSATAAFKVGAIALAFLIVGYQTALFVHKAAVARIVANRDTPDTVYIREIPEQVGDDGREVGDTCVIAGQFGNLGDDGRDVGDTCVIAGQFGNLGDDGRDVGGPDIVRHNAPHSKEAQKIWSHAPKKVESFAFNPNTVSLTDLQRLGFSEKQAQSIINYREKGGRFRRKSDFAKSYVVSDSVYQRLESYIVIPKIDINKADSATFDSLPGIGGYFARKMVEYRGQLHGYSCPEQLLEIYRFDEDKLNGLRDLITCSAPKPYPFWEGDLESIKAHPHIRSASTARAIILYRDNNPKELWTIEGLLEAGIISSEQATKLSRCRLR